MIYFHSKTNNETIQETTLELKKPIPRLIGDSDSLLTSAADLKKSMQSLDPKQFFMNFVYQGSLNYFWGQINTF